MNNFEKVDISNLDVEWKKLQLNKNDVILIKSKKITNDLILNFTNYCKSNNIHNFIVFLNDDIQLETIDKQNLIIQLQKEISTK